MKSCVQYFKWTQHEHLTAYLFLRTEEEIYTCKLSVELFWTLSAYSACLCISCLSSLQSAHTSQKIPKPNPKPNQKNLPSPPPPQSRQKEFIKSSGENSFYNAKEKKAKEVLKNKSNFWNKFFKKYMHIISK